MLFCCDIREFCEFMLSKSRNVLKNTLLLEQWQYRKSGYKIVGQLYETLSIEQCTTNIYCDILKILIRSNPSYNDVNIYLSN